MNIGYKLVKNVMPATAEKAPYLGMAIPVGSLAYDNILKEMIKAGTKMTQPTAKYFLDALYEYAAKAIADEVVRINIGSVSLYPAIDGSFDTEDANFDPKRNTLYVGASFSQELRDQVAGIAPDFAGDKSVGTVKLHSCMDLGTQVFKVIRGTESFRLAGENLTVPDGSDESLGLYAKDGVTKVTDIEVSETDGGQRITCHLMQADAAIPKGTYKVRLASHGLDPTDPLTVATLTVTLTEDIPARPEPLYRSEDGLTVIREATDSDGVNQTMDAGKSPVLRGELAKVANVTLKYVDDDEHYIAGDITRSGGEAGIVFDAETLATITPGTYPDCNLQVGHVDGGEPKIAHIPVTFVVPES